MVSGTRGFAQKWPKRTLAFESDAHNALSDENMEKMLKEYEHPITKEIGELPVKWWSWWYGLYYGLPVGVLSAKWF